MEIEAGEKSFGPEDSDGRPGVEVDRPGAGFGPIAIAAAELKECSRAAYPAFDPSSMRPLQPKPACKKDRLGR